MRPFFSLHAGEQLVAAHIEQRFRRVQLWVPTRDTGVDLLVSGRNHRRTVALQVKYSKDFLVTNPARFGPLFQQNLRACGWWTITRDKLQRSPADYWVFVLHGFAARTVDYVVIPPKELWRRIRMRTPTKTKVHLYLWTTAAGRCWETRDVKRTDELRILAGAYQNDRHDFTRWLDNWSSLTRLNR